jgi:type IV pilus biogenesis protein CpaD/CtpE
MDSLDQQAGLNIIRGNLRTSNMAQDLQGVFRKYREHSYPAEVIRISGGTHNQHCTLTTSMGAQDQQYGSGLEESTEDQQSTSKMQSSLAHTHHQVLLSHLE